MLDGLGSNGCGSKKQMVARYAFPRGSVGTSKCLGAHGRSGCRYRVGRAPDVPDDPPMMSGNAALLPNLPLCALS